MKKVLIIADLPQASPRISGLAKYLPEFSWKPIVLTGTPLETLNQKFKIILAPYTSVIVSLKKKLHLHPTKSFQEQIGIPLVIRGKKRPLTDKLITFIKEVIAYPDVERNWEIPAIKAAEEFLQKEKVDAIISSSSPVTAHIIANKLKQKYKIPWIADFRDLWTQNENYPYGPIRKFFEQKLELKTLTTSDYLITISYPLEEKLQILHNGKPTYTITNGFDLNIVNIPPLILTNEFTITYTGQFYSGKRDPLNLFISLRELISDGIMDSSDIEIRFYGPREEWVEKEIRKYKLTDVAKQYGLVSRDVSLKKQRESQILLFLNWEDKQDKGVYSGKIFEYLAARRPILSVGGGGKDVIEELLNETKAGVYCSQIEDIKNYLLKFYLEYKQKGKVSYQGDIKTINKYSYREMARKFAEALNSLAIENKVC